jgi:hypothetical protein
MTAMGPQTKGLKRRIGACKLSYARSLEINRLPDKLESWGIIYIGLQVPTHTGYFFQQKPLGTAQHGIL